MHVALQLGQLALTPDLVTTSPTTALVGPSGAGKSTVLRIIAGLERRAVGTLSVGADTWQDSERKLHLPPWERRVGWVPQEAILFPHLDVGQNLRYGGGSAEQAREIAELLEVAPLLSRRPRHLSGGERQRVALGRALLSSPRLLLLDEPFAALDRALRESIGPRLRDHCTSQGIPYLLVSHDERDVAALADEVWVLEGGTLRAL